MTAQDLTGVVCAYCEHPAAKHGVLGCRHREEAVRNVGDFVDETGRPVPVDIPGVVCDCNIRGPSQ